MSPTAIPAPAGKTILVKRHRLSVRIPHWINVLCLSFLLLSGLQIFNAHPHLYWGQYGADDDKPIFSIEAVNKDGALHGVTRIGSIELPTTGVLGASTYNGQVRNRALSRLAHHSELSRSRRRTELAFLLRLAVRHQRLRLSPLSAC